MNQQQRTIPSKNQSKSKSKSISRQDKLILYYQQLLFSEQRQKTSRQILIKQKNYEIKQTVFYSFGQRNSLWLQDICYDALVIAEKYPLEPMQQDFVQDELIQEKNEFICDYFKKIQQSYYQVYACLDWLYMDFYWRQMIRQYQIKLSALFISLITTLYLLYCLINNCFLKFSQRLEFNNKCPIHQNFIVGYTDLESQYYYDSYLFLHDSNQYTITYVIKIFMLLIYYYPFHLFLSLIILTIFCYLVYRFKYLYERIKIYYQRLYKQRRRQFKASNEILNLRYNQYNNFLEKNIVKFQEWYKVFKKDIRMAYYG